MNLFFKIFLISFLVFVAGFGLVQAGSSDLFSGYAWSENIGWISFNSISDGSSYDYGVTFSELDGDLDGQAWSENIGWISFKRSEAGNPPFPPFNDDNPLDPIANLDLGTHEMSGWGRALSACMDDNWNVNQCTASTAGDKAGGWDGWIKLSSTSTPAYGVTRNTSQKLEGYAWGGSVVGWISFNSDTDGSAYNYAVEVYGGDTDDPISQIISPPQGSWQLEDFVVTYLDEDPGGSGVNEAVGKCRYQVFSYNGGENSSDIINRTCGVDGHESVTINVGPETDECQDEGVAACYVYLYSEDMAGNEGSSNLFYDIDWTAPVPGKLYDTATSTAPEPLLVTEGEIYTLGSNITDNLKVASCALFINGEYQSNTVTLGSGTTYRIASVDYQFILNPGTYNNNYMRCRDAAGNTDSGPMTTFIVTGGTGPIITGLTAYSSHCDTPSTECTSQYDCCMDYTTQSNCCVKFNLSAYEPDGLPLTYSWTFGDSGTSTDEDPYHHYSSADSYTATVTVSNGTEDSQRSIGVVVTNPTLSVNLSAIPSFGSAPLNNVDLRDIVAGTMFGTVDYRFDCTNNSVWDLEVLSQSSIDHTATDVCSYAEGSYTAKTTISRGTGSPSDTIGIVSAGSCVYNADPELNESTTCNSDQGCSHSIDCQSDNTWPSCPEDDCTVGDTTTEGCTGGEKTCSASCAWGDCVGEGDCTSDFDCYCPLDSCSGGDYYNYPIYGSCTDYFCDVGVAIGDPCGEPELSISINDPSCNTPPVCNSLTPVPSSGVGPLDVTLTASAVDDDGYVDYYEFTFGDGTYTTVASTTNGIVSHEYAEPATASTTYTAEVKARDEDYDWSTVNATTSIVVTKNIPPVALLGCDTSSCGTGSSCDINGTSIAYNQNCQFVFTNLSTDDDSTDASNTNHIVQSDWFIAGWYGLENAYNTYNAPTTMNNLTLPLGMPLGSDYILLEVTDAKGSAATTSADFYMRREIVSSFQCSLDPGEEKVWKSCNNLSVSENETVYLKDLSVASETAGEGTATITSWDWTFTGGTPSTSSLQEPTVSFIQEVANTGRIELVVTDDAGRTDTKNYDLIITIPLPEWQEIAPI